MRTSVSSAMQPLDVERRASLCTADERHDAAGPHDPRGRRGRSPLGVERRRVDPQRGEDARARRGRDRERRFSTGAPLLEAVAVDLLAGA